jgi:hypothetical protein
MFAADLASVLAHECRVQLVPNRRPARSSLCVRLCE